MVLVTLVCCRALLQPNRSSRRISQPTRKLRTDMRAMPLIYSCDGFATRLEWIRLGIEPRDFNIENKGTEATICH